jgi:HlyD family secretion protein/macrolide-specific efflux system membrane fusion protein
MNAPKKRKWPTRLVVVVVVAALAGGALWKLKGGDDAPLDEALLTRVKREDLVLEVIDTGKIAPLEKVDIKSKVSGQVLEVLVDEGQRVKKGQLLLRLDPVDYAREAARADAELAQAKQALAFAASALARKQAAFAERAVPQTEVELAQNDVDMRQASIKIAEVAVNAANDRLKSCDVKSPLTGTVIQRGVEPGEVVTAGVQATVEGKPLLTVADLSTLIVKSELNQIDVARVALGQSVKLSLDALPGKTFTARVTKIAPAAVKAEARDAEVFPVEATLDDAGVAGAADAGVPGVVAGAADAGVVAGAADGRGAIKSGMTADVRILVETLPQVLLVPIEAVRKEEGKTTVKKVVVDADGKKKGEQVEVKTGKSNDRQMQIKDGVKEGDELVVDPGSSKDNEAKL